MRKCLLLYGMLVCLAGCRIPAIPPVTTFSKVGLTGTTDVIVNMPPDADHGPMVEMPVVPYPKNGCGKIAVIDVDGLLVYEERTGLFSLGQNPVAVFREKLDYIANNPNGFCGGLLRINSPGGGVTATDIMARELIAFKARTGLPVVTCIMAHGAGGAYYLAQASDHIIAHPTSVVGGIGVILNLYNVEGQMAQFNIFAVPIKSGKNIDLGTPTMREGETKQQRRILATMANEFHERFITVVKQSRPVQVEDERSNFDGRVFTAAQAYERGLIDEVGYLDEAMNKVAELGNCQDAGLVMIHRKNDPVNSPYDISPNTPLQKTLLAVNVPGLDRSKLPTFLYLWQPEPSLSTTDSP